MKANKHERMYKQIVQHGNNLNDIFHTGLDPVILCKKMHSLEIKAHKLATDYCNGENGITSENWDDKCAPILKAVKNILNVTDNFPIFVNGDARGYALKIDDEYMRKCQHLAGYNRLHKDWGGYGIIAPEFDGGE
jgi:hypothetical protein